MTWDSEFRFIALGCRHVRLVTNDLAAYTPCSNLELLLNAPDWSAGDGGARDAGSPLFPSSLSAAPASSMLEAVAR